jgi:hypothetical protein
LAGTDHEGEVSRRAGRLSTRSLHTFFGGPGDAPLLER